MGSSPLTRGKTLHAARDVPNARLIPAHAGKTEIPSAQRRVSKAHPRSRGENPRSRPSYRPAEGSSPLTRGKRGSDQRMVWSSGLIPAHAGKTTYSRSIASAVAAHPRSRGENHRMKSVAASFTGSSPLTRGKPAIVALSAAHAGLIPAHAGKTRYPAIRRWRAGAHPRSRGENQVVHEVHPRVQGSSPLTRGKPGGPRGTHPRRRLIPAHAGKTHEVAEADEARGAHPRSRGENSARLAVTVDHEGSSPLTRGKHEKPNEGACNTGRIPAHAGKTYLHRLHRSGACGSSPLTRGKRLFRLGCHHRRRLIPAHAGKTEFRRIEAADRPGSSPLTRGKHAVGGQRVGHAGLIPAHAGKTEIPNAQRRVSRAHPRSRGENAKAVEARRKEVGSSPLTRGKP